MTPPSPVYCSCISVDFQTFFFSDWINCTTLLYASSMLSFFTSWANSMLWVSVNFFYNHCGIVHLLYVNQLKDHLIVYELHPTIDNSSEHVFEERLASGQVFAFNLLFFRNMSLAIGEDAFRSFLIYIFCLKRSNVSSMQTRLLKICTNILLKDLHHFFNNFCCNM